MYVYMNLLLKVSRFFHDLQVNIIIYIIIIYIIIYIITYKIIYNNIII